MSSINEMSKERLLKLVMKYYKNITNKKDLVNELLEHFELDMNSFSKNDIHKMIHNYYNQFSEKDLRKEIINNFDLELPKKKEPKENKYFIFVKNVYENAKEYYEKNKDNIKGIENLVYPLYQQTKEKFTSLKDENKKERDGKLIILDIYNNKKNEKFNLTYFQNGIIHILYYPRGLGSHSTIPATYPENKVIFVQSNKYKLGF